MTSFWNERAGLRRETAGGEKEIADSLTAGRAMTTIVDMAAAFDGSRGQGASWW